MKERPIICRDDEVRALIEGRKTQLRRPVKPIFSDAFPGTPLFKVDGGIHVPLNDAVALTSAFPRHCPFGIAGERLWVRECWAPMCAGRKTRVAYRSTMMIQNQTPMRGPARNLVPWPVDNTGRKGHAVRLWRSSSQMPRWASRLALDITNVRVERLQDITEQDAISEGVPPFFQQYSSFSQDQRLNTGELCADAPHRASFAVMWDENCGNKDHLLWIRNPFVWVIETKVVQP